MLLLVGGTGNLGGRIARRLTAYDLPFRALVRPSTDPGELTSTATAIVPGDLRDVSGLRPTVEGIDTVIASAHTLDRCRDPHRKAATPAARALSPSLRPQGLAVGPGSGDQGSSGQMSRQSAIAKGIWLVTVAPSIT